MKRTIRKAAGLALLLAVFGALFGSMWFEKGLAHAAFIFGVSAALSLVVILALSLLAE